VVFQKELQIPTFFFSRLEAGFNTEHHLAPSLHPVTVLVASLQSTYQWED
jgi:hypothetical protein